MIWQIFFLIIHSPYLVKNNGFALEEDRKTSAYSKLPVSSQENISRDPCTTLVQLFNSYFTECLLCDGHSPHQIGRWICRIATNLVTGSTGCNWHIVHNLGLQWGQDFRSEAKSCLRWSHPFNTCIWSSIQVILQNFLRSRLRLLLSMIRKIYFNYPPMHRKTQCWLLKECNGSLLW